VVAGVSNEVLQLWNSAKKTRTYMRGELVFRDGEPSAGVYCSYSGLIKLYRSSAEGEVQILRLVSGMHVMGHGSLLCDQPLTCTAEVLRDAQICFVDRQTVLQSMALDSRLSINLARLLARELSRAEDLLFSVSCLSTKARLARLLLNLTQDGEWSLELTRAEMGQVIGSSPESISRALHSLTRDGSLRLEKRRIAVSDREKLTFQASFA